MGDELVDMNRFRVRSIERADLQTVVGLNNAEVPAVTTLDEARAAELVDMCAAALCVVDLGADTAVVLADGGDGGDIPGADGTVCAFCFVMPPGVAYTSANYRWVSEHFDSFIYLDRICVSPNARRQGLGAKLYAAVRVAAAHSVPEAKDFVLEVNSRPANDVSLAFHQSMGFVEVGRAEPYDDGTEVVYLSTPL